MDSDSKTWTVVHFIEENMVEAVPTTWIIGKNECLWPPHQWTSEKIRHCIKSCTFDTCWESYNVKIFKNATYSDYELAFKKTKKAELYSDLNTDTETDRKRKRMPSRRFADSSSENDDQDFQPLSYLKEPPKFKNFDHSNKSSAIGSGSQGSIKKKLTSSFNKVIDSRGNDKISSDIQHSNSAKSFQNTSLEHISMSSEEISQFTLNTERNNSININENRNGNHNTDNCGNCCPYQIGLIKNLIKQQKMIKDVLTDINRNYENIMNRQENKIVSPASKQTIFRDFTFPLESHSELKQLDDYLEDENVFEKAIVEISRFGGKDNADFVKRCLHHIVSNKVAVNYSWLGRREKQNFKDLFKNIVKLIVVTAENSCKAKDRKETEEFIKAWLRRAAERKKKSNE